MPLQRVTLANQQAEVDLPFAGESLHVVWRPYVYTPELEEQLARVEQERSPGRAYAEALSRLIISWDYLDEKGKPVKTDMDTLAKEPSRFLSQVMQGLAASLRPPAPSSTNSTFG